MGRWRFTISRRVDREFKCCFTRLWSVGGLPNFDIYYCTVDMTLSTDVSGYEGQNNQEEIPKARANLGVSSETESDGEMSKDTVFFVKQYRKNAGPLQKQISQVFLIWSRSKQNRLNLKMRFHFSCWV